MISIITAYVPSVLQQLTDLDVIVPTFHKNEFNKLIIDFPHIKPVLVPNAQMEPQPPLSYYDHESKLAAVSCAKHDWICFLDSAIDLEKIRTFIPGKELVYIFADAHIIHKSIVHIKQFRNYAMDVETCILQTVPKSIIQNNKNIDKGISVIIPYCSLERDLLDDVLQSVDGTCDEIILVYMTHFWDGTPDTETPSVIAEFKKKYKIKDICLEWTADSVSSTWECKMRKHAFLNSTKDWILFIDSDEVLRNKDAFTKWFQSIRDGSVHSYKLANYWYFLSKQRRAKPIEDSIVLIKRNEITLRHFDQFKANRDAFVNKNTPRYTKDLNAEPMFDHFSWVRSKDVLLKKVKAWGHHGDKDWVPLLEKAFSEDILTTKDFVHNYTYDIIN